MRSRVLLGLLVGAVALVIALWGAPATEIAAALRAAHAGWLLPVAAIFMVQQVLRAVRQALLVGAGPDVSFRTSLSVLCISFLFINTLPARLGEAVRPLLLWERARVPLGAAVAMVVVERAIDLLAALVMLAAVAWLVPVRAPALVVGGVSVDWAELGRWAAGIGAPLLVLALVVVLLGGRPILRLVERGSSRLPSVFQEPARLVLRFGEGFAAGLEGIRTPRRLSAIGALTVVIWGISGWMYALAARAFDVGSYIGYGEGMGVLATTMLGMALPSAPGFAGTYEASFRAALALYGVVGPGLDGVAVAFALTYHWWQYGVQACSALWFLAVDRIDPVALGRRALGAWRGYKT